MTSVFDIENSVRVHSLASGSSGNAMLVQATGVNILIDAGMPVRSLVRALANQGVGNGNLNGILLTHEHTDHTLSAVSIARKTGAPLIGNFATLTAYGEREPITCALREVPTGESINIGAVEVRSFPVPHDAQEPVGYVIHVGQIKIAYFTDAGSVTSHIREAVKDAQLAIVEANHDLDWLLRGSYTQDMKERVASSTGHLSNADCADLIAERVEEGGPCTVWLAHLSRVNNSPYLARRTVLSRVTRRTKNPFHLEVALRDQPSVSWRIGNRAFQLSLL